MSGIRERRHFPAGTRPSLIATRAAEDCLERSTTPREDIDLLIYSAVCRDFMEPATASVVHKALGLSHRCALFDLSDACLGFANAMLVAAAHLEHGLARAALIVSGEDGGPLVEATIKRLNEDTSITRKSSKLSFASLTIGSGGAAMLLTRQENPARPLLGGVALTATEHNGLCSGGMTAGRIGADLGPLMETDSEALLQAGAALAGATWRDTRELLGWSNSDVGRVITHQVGVAHRRAVFGALELEPALDYPTVEFLGNIGSAALPIALALAEREGRLEGRNVALLGIGSGLVCLNLGLRWSKHGGGRA
jgi:3-oxoacyl-[acyl-carrier-protein] synthase-3